MDFWKTFNHLIRTAELHSYALNGIPFLFQICAVIFCNAELSCSVLKTEYFSSWH